MNHDGFQLLEMMLVCLLLGAAVITSAGPLIQTNQYYQLHSAGQSLVAALSEARSLAITTNLPLEIHVDDQERRFGFAPRGEQARNWTHLPSGVRFARVPRSRVTFYSRGFAVPSGSFVIENGVGMVRVVVSAAGRVRWEKITGEIENEG